MKVPDLLLSLSDVDREIVNLLDKKEEMESSKVSILTELEEVTSEIESLEAEIKQGASRQALEEHRLKDEQQKIMERRKQLTAIGGAKVARMVEREIDIASRTLETMEESTMKAMEEVDALNSKVSELKERAKELEKEKKEKVPTFDSEISGILTKVKKLETTRKTKLEKLEPRLRRLYTRVQGRYQGNPVAMAQKVSCRSCFRSLPNQTYNQILAGNSLIQCPGCQRILVYTGEDKS